MRKAESISRVVMSTNAGSRGFQTEPKVVSKSPGPAFWNVVSKSSVFFFKSFLCVRIKCVFPGVAKAMCVSAGDTLHDMLEHGAQSGVCGEG